MLDDLFDRIGAGTGVVFLHIRKIVGHQTSLVGATDPVDEGCGALRNLCARSILLTGAKLRLRPCPSQPSGSQFATGKKCHCGLSFRATTPYIRFVGLTDYGDKWAMK